MELRHMKQDLAESVRDYAHRIRHTIKRAGVAGNNYTKEALATFQTGLRSELISLRICEKDYETFDQAVDDATKYEATLAARKTILYFVFPFSWVCFVHSWC